MHRCAGKGRNPGDLHGSRLVVYRLSLGGLSCIIGSGQDRRIER